MKIPTTFIVAAMMSLNAVAADIRETARTTAQQQQKAVVTVRLVSKLKINMMGQNQDTEQKNEVTGTVIDPSGLTVVDAASIDPTALIKSMLGNMGGMGLKMDSEVKETMILLDDGTEVEAEVVLKDSDLGLAFVRPKDTSKKFEAVALKQRNGPPQLLDEVFTVERLSKNGNRAPALSLDCIRAVVKGPRSFYVGEKESQSSLGCVAYSAQGEPLGIYVLKPQPAAAGDDGGGMGLGMLAHMGDMKNALMVVVRPVNDVIEIAEQAKKAKPAAEKKP